MIGAKDELITEEAFEEIVFSSLELKF